MSLTNLARRNHRGQQYSINALTDSSGTIKERYAYDAYGNLSIFDGSGTAGISTAEDNRYTYTGREWDEELDLYHYRARMYDPMDGRFLSRDPLINIRTILNLYAGVFAAKSGLDPGGNDWVMPWNPDAQWWFNMENPWAPGQVPPGPDLTPRQPNALNKLLTRAPPWLLVLAPCLAGALAGAGIDALIDYVENGTIPPSNIGRNICAAVSGCFLGTCTVVVTVGVLGTGATCGAYLLVGGASFVACSVGSDKVCELCDKMVGGATSPFFCNLWD